MTNANNAAKRTSDVEVERALRIALEIDPAAGRWARSDAAQVVNDDLRRHAHPVVRRLPSREQNRLLAETLQQWWTEGRKLQWTLANSDRPGIHYARRTFRYMSLAVSFDGFRGAWRTVSLAAEPCSATGLSTSPDEAERHRNVREAMRLVPQASRDLLLQRYAQAKPLAVIALALGVSVPTACRRVQQARAELVLAYARAKREPAATPSSVEHHLR